MLANKNYIPDHVRWRLNRDEELEQQQEQINKYLEQHDMIEVFQAAYPKDWLNWIDDVLTNLSCEDSAQATKIVNDTIAIALTEEKHIDAQNRVDAQIETLTYGA